MRRVGPAVVAKAALVGLGVLAMGWGLRGIVVEAERVHPRSFGTWFVGSLVAHDFVIAPLVFAVGALLLPRVRPPYRACVQGALIVTGVLVLVSIPVVGGYGRRADNPSTLPLDYDRNLVVIVALVWAVAFAVAAWQVWRHRPRRASAPGTERTTR